MFIRLICLKSPCNVKIILKKDGRLGYEKYLIRQRRIDGINKITTIYILSHLVNPVYVNPPKADASAVIVFIERVLTMRPEELNYPLTYSHNDQYYWVKYKWCCLSCKTFETG